MQGLVGCLLVGLNAAKTLSLVHNKPYIGVNHLNAHVSANFIDTDLKPPFICLLVSGGHSQIIYVEDYDKQIRYVNNLEEKINLPKSLVVKYIFSDGGWFVFRPSGTEPKLKIYISIKGNTKEEARHAVDELKAALNKIIENI